MSEVTRESWVFIISMFYVGINGMIDIYKKKISLFLVIIYGLIWMCIFMKGFYTDGLLMDKLLGMLPGMVLLLLSIVTKGAIGCGDGILVIPMGLYLGIRRVGVMLLWAFGLAFLWSIFMYCLRRKLHKTDAFPFVPFLFMGLIGVLIW